MTHEKIKCQREAISSLSLENSKVKFTAVFTATVIGLFHMQSAPLLPTREMKVAVLMFTLSALHCVSKQQVVRLNRDSEFEGRLSEFD